MRLIIPRSPDHPISLEEWRGFRETVGTCQRKMETLLGLAEAGPLDSLLALLTGLTETIEQYTKQGNPPPMTVVGRPGRPVKKEEEEPSEQPQ